MQRRRPVGSRIMASLKLAAISGAKWTAVSSGVVATVQFFRIAILARLLLPEDFGLMAILALILGLAKSYADLGISSSIIHRQDTTDLQLSSLYWLNILAGAATFVVIVAASPLFVMAFSEVRLYSLIPYAALTFLIASLGQQFRTLLQKELQFERLALIEIGSAVINTAVAIGAALNGLGVLALVFGYLAGAAFSSVSAAWIGVRRWRPRFHFRRDDLRGHLSFGLYQMARQTLVFIGSRVDQLIIGAVLGPTALGFYSLAWNLVIQPVSRINPILTKVAFPLFSKVQQDAARLRRGYMLLLWTLTLVNAPILVGCATIAGLFVPLLLGEKWVPAVPLVQALALVGLFRAMGNPVGSLLLARGRADLGFKWNLALLFFQVPGVYLGSRFGGVEGVALAVVLLQIFFNLASYPFLIRVLLGPCLGEYLRSQLPPLAIAAAMGLVVWLVPSVIDVPRVTMLVVAVTVGAIIYIGLTLVLEHARLRELKTLLVRR